MKSPGKLPVVAAVSAMAVAGFPAAVGSAVAVTPQSRIHSMFHPAAEATEVAETGDPPPELIGPNGEKPTQWGTTSFPVDSSRRSVTPRSTENVGGGTWSYGTTAADGVKKGCYSNYLHPDKKHSASIAIADATDKDVRKADVWAKAYGSAGAAHRCHAYWGVY